MDEEIAIRITNLSKKYSLSEKRTGISLSERLMQFFVAKTQKKEKTEVFYALKEINLEIKKGESIGIIGRNGAGKSTLLKILSEVVEPTEGTIEINGRIASVLEIGMGFHPELSGKENIFLSGTMLGIPKNKLLENYQAIVEFSGVDKFIDTPVKHYSSGMFVRLAFAIVANVDADILLFDEVLSVGDLSFQIKCLETIESLSKKGKTVLIVSHNLNDIMRISSRVLYFENGHLKSDSLTGSLEIYYKDSLLSNSLFENGKSNFGIPRTEKRMETFEKSNYNQINEDIQLKRFFVCAANKGIDEEITTNDEIELTLEYCKLQDTDFFDVCFSFSHFNAIIVYAQSVNSDYDIKLNTASGEYIAKVRVPSHFFNDIVLQIGFNIFKNNEQVIFANKNFLELAIKRSNAEMIREQALGGTLSKYIGPVYPKWPWMIRLKEP